MKRLKTNIRLNIQLAIAIVLVMTGVGLLLAGFVVPPTGEIHSSVLVAFGESCTFAGSLVGVDYHYRYKTYSDYRRAHPGHMQPPEEPEDYEDNQ